MLQWPLVGRRDEQDRLWAALEDAAVGRGSLVLLAGEAGIGKSALLRAAARQVIVSGAAVGYCPGPGETGSFAPWLEVVEQLADGHPNAKTSPAPLGPGMAASGSYQLAAALAEWLKGLSRPLLIGLEDLQWADRPSLDLLRYLTPMLGRMGVVVAGTYRHDEVGPGGALWTVLPHLQRLGATTLVLQGLSPSDVRTLTELVLPQRPDGSTLASLLHERTRGHPLFLQELITVTAQTGAVPGPDSALPDSLQQAVDQRVLQLSQPARTVLQAAAVVGERFHFDLLAQVLSLKEEELAGGLEEALAARMIRLEGSQGDQFMFGHALVRDALLQRLIGPRRRLWHARVAEALLCRPSPDPEVLAYHLVRAGDDRAAAFLTAAGDRALHMDALDHAAPFYEQAAERMARSGKSTAELMLKLGWAKRLSDMSRAHQLWVEALKGAESAGETAVAVWARHMLGLWQVWTNQPDCLAWLEWVEREQESLQEDPEFQRLEADLFRSRIGYPRMAVTRALTLCAAGRLEEAGAVAARLRTLRLAEAHRHDLINIERALSFVSGRLREASEATLRLTEEARRSGRYSMAVNMAMEHYVQLIWCRADEPDLVDQVAERLATLEAEAQERTGNSVLAAGFSTLGWYQYLRGDWARARHNLIGYLERHPDDPLPGLRWWASLLHEALGEHAAARATLYRVAPFSPGDDPGFCDLAMVIALLCQRAVLADSDGSHLQAKNWLEAADRYMAQRGVGPVQAYLRLGWAHHFQSAGNLPKARDEGENALAHAESVHDMYSVIRCHRLLGEVKAALGRENDATQHFSASRTLAERCRFPYEAALTDLAFGQLLPLQPGARRRLASARDLFERLGARPALVACEAALAAPDGQPAQEAAPRQPLPDGLSEREVEVIRLVAQGLTDRETAARLFISPRTVDGHMRNIYMKLDISNRAALVAYAARRNLLG